MIGGVRGMQSLIAKHYWWLLIVLICGYLVLETRAWDEYHRILVAEQGVGHTDD